MGKIQIRIQRNYGIDCLYVVDSEQAKLIRGLTGKKTVSEQELRNLSALGFEIQYVSFEELEELD